MVKYVKYEYNEKTQHGKIHASRGLIPEKIWNRPSMQSYVNNYPFGYVGNLNRRKATDRAVMRYFRDAKKSDKFIEDQFLSNSTGRHMSDMWIGKTESQIYKDLESHFGKVNKKSRC
jgi:hypothetical protein